MVRPAVLIGIGLLLTGAWSAAEPVSVTATDGVSIDLGRITIGAPLRGGDEFLLPAFSVENPGDERATYRIGIGGLSADDGLTPQNPWFTFNPSEFVLEPGASQLVRGRLDLPVDVAAGTYVALVRAELAPAGAGSLVGAAAAARLEFVVAEVGASRGAHEAGALPDGGDAFGVLHYVAIVALVLGAVVLVGRRYRISIRRR